MKPEFRKEANISSSDMIRTLNSLVGCLYFISEQSEDYSGGIFASKKTYGAGFLRKNLVSVCLYESGIIIRGIKNILMQYSAAVCFHGFYLGSIGAGAFIGALFQ